MEQAQMTVQKRKYSNESLFWHGRWAISVAMALCSVVMEVTAGDLKGGIYFALLAIWTKPARSRPL
jgi:hypothetical protein